jgi:hypothetical protein
VTISCQRRDYVLYHNFFVGNSQTDGVISIIVEDPETIPRTFGQPDSVLSLKDSIYCVHYKGSYFKISYKPAYIQTYFIKDSNFYIIVDPKTKFKIGDPAKKLVKHFSISSNSIGESLKVNFAYEQDRELIKERSYLIFFLSNNKIKSILCVFVSTPA